MIATTVIDSIRELLAEGRMSRRKIARHLGVSRGTVANVAAGRRPDYEAIRRRREENQQPIMPGPVARCPTCGGKVHMPCRLCMLREELAKQSPRCHDRRPFESLGIDLRGDARMRYEAIHRERMRRGEPCEMELTDGRATGPLQNEDWS